MTDEQLDEMLADAERADYAPTLVGLAATVTTLATEVKRLTKLVAEMTARERELVAALKPFAEATTVPFPGMAVALNVATAILLAAKEDTTRE